MMGRPDFPNMFLNYKADSEMWTHDGAFQNDFSEQNRSWDDSGTIISET